MSSIFLNAAITICFIAGKSGGHLIPCITQAKTLHTQNPQAQLYVFTSASPLDKKILAPYPDIKMIETPSLDNPPYHNWLLMPWFACKTVWYGIISLKKLWQLKPTSVISFGGFISIPVCIAAKILQIPIKICELNVQPGRATLFLSHLTDTIYTCFQSTKKYFPQKKCIMMDYPVRFSQTDKVFDKTNFLEKHNFSDSRKTILILGGSQGSTVLNKIFKETVEEFQILQNNIQIIHQTGSNDSFNYQLWYQEKNIPCIVFSYHDRLEEYYNAADIIISRAGAGTLFEIKFFDKKCICIPHQTASTNHQIENILELAKENPDQFSIIPQSELKPSLLYQHILQLACLQEQPQIQDLK